MSRGGKAQKRRHVEFRHWCSQQLLKQKPPVSVRCRERAPKAGYLIGNAGFAALQKAFQ